ncbi:DUF188 domain-containing protein [Sporolactobacillus shoreicorticis]|uniref:UPF0178 protein ACFSUE_12715 n=1 Tax=Sporolactobacillus shoreicorticis TaxID=1923877 RepID=A0ABW5S6C1_9BACL|nr:DUF188 domain-containing protein [Sporolactobacillus shoreicorticis]MCO7126324.1 DUF188 domain-containing protein [Sporolactobacillus shoreicorticis]
MKKIMLFVDADACPVKKEIIMIAQSFGLEPIFVASYASYSPNREGRWVFVDQRKEAADLYIVNHVSANDIVITQDVGLAGLLTRRRVFVLSIRGLLIDERNIDMLLEQRYQAYQALNAGEKVRGPRPFTDQNRKKFSEALTKLLCRLDH